MRVALTGVPGTGKTTVAGGLGWDVVTVLDLARLHGCSAAAGGVEEIDTEALGARMDLRGDLVVEGHLSHLLPLDAAVVLRCDPRRLKERLAPRGYASEKVEENLLAEALDVCLIEAVERLGPSRVAEIDTSGRTEAETIGDVRQAISALRRNESIERWRPGRVDWSSTILGGEVG